ncbi:hypothetical protein NQ314_005841 [Rhamnusium bicolor]|uniref:Anoctamin n=1 Tax=Rhamnusium bicolor TaxID=1586634 RepID=A0AAV8ZFA0_9CUCU|nr:hypothetical protein NQ314_005841 [Rhamnusium bicolor]
MWMCPTCKFGTYCTFERLSHYCSLAKYNYIFDNYLTIAFAVFMSFWATLFINWWRRKENKLKLRWDVRHQNPTLNAR